jgi:V8-like Glu-specific endopeptidase
MKNAIYRIIAVILVASLIITMNISAVASTSEEDRDDGGEVQISSSAGKGGVRVYDMETGEEKYIPPIANDGSDNTPIPASEELMEEDVTASARIRDMYKLTPVSSVEGRYASTCLIASRFIKDGKEDHVEIGTGWLINDSYLMTAGHILYSGDYGYAHHTAVYVGASGGNYKQYRLGHVLSVGGDFFDHPSYFEYDSGYLGTLQKQNYDDMGMFDDWGIVKLDSPVTANVGHLGRYAINQVENMYNRYYYTQGYPGALQTASSWNKFVMYEEYGLISGEVQMRYLPLVWSGMTGYPGQSGSPLYSYRTGLGYCAEGILVSNATLDSRRVTQYIMYNDWLNNYVNTYCK